MTLTSPVDTWERLVRFQRIAMMEMDRNLRSTCGHSLDEYDVLHQLRRHGEPIRMGDLAGRLLVANSSCHRLVGRLVEAGFVTRLRSEDDGRTVLVQLTPDGRRLHRRMAATHTRDIERFVGAQLSRAQLDQLDGSLDALLLGAPDMTD